MTTSLEWSIGSASSTCTALTLPTAVAIAHTLTAELTLMAIPRGDLVAECAAATRLAKSTDGQRERAEAELAQLSGTRPAATIRAKIAGMFADHRMGNCTVMDGPRDLRPDFPPIRGRVLGWMVRSPTCPHRRVDFPVAFGIDGLVASMQWSSAAGGLLPIAPCGLTSL